MKRPRFGSSVFGGWVQPVPNADAASLRTLLKGAHGLPAVSQKHSGFDDFLRAVERICAHHSSMHGDESKSTAASRRDALLALEAAAHRMQNALKPLELESDSNELFEDMDPVYGFLAQRARDPRVEGRPAVPAIPKTLPTDLGELLAQIDEGLTALRATCAYAAAQFSPSAAVDKAKERELAKAIARAHADAFGALPPAGGWFRSFMAELGCRMKWGSIGHKVVKEAVDALKAEATPPPG